MVELKRPTTPSVPVAEVVVIAGEPGRIRGGSSNLDSNVGYSSGGVAACIPENVVLEVACIVNHIAEEGERVGRGGDAGAAYVHTVEVIVRSSSGNVQDADDREACGNGVTGRIKPKPHHVILERSSPCPSITKPQI
jgi:hypothetical protein